MEAVLSKDAEYSDNYLDFSANEKRLVRVGVKSYQKTGEYITLKLFKRESSDSSYSFNQKIALSSDEFQTFLEKLNKIKRMLAQNKPKTERNEKKKDRTVKQDNNLLAKNIKWMIKTKLSLITNRDGRSYV